MILNSNSIGFHITPHIFILEGNMKVHNHPTTFGSRASKADRSSSPAALFALIIPQVVQRWRIMSSPSTFCHKAIGCISPLQRHALSPGRMSTCLLYRQCGQWLRCLVPHAKPDTGMPQWMQLKSSDSVILLHPSSIVVQQLSQGFVLLLPSSQDFFKTRSFSPQFQEI